MQPDGSTEAEAVVVADREPSVVSTAEDDPPNPLFPRMGKGAGISSSEHAPSLKKGMVVLANEPMRFLSLPSAFRVADKEADRKAFRREILERVLKYKK